MRKAVRLGDERAWRVKPDLQDFVQGLEPRMAELINRGLLGALMRDAMQQFEWESDEIGRCIELRRRRPLPGWIVRRGQEAEQRPRLSNKLADALFERMYRSKKADA